MPEFRLAPRAASAALLTFLCNMSDHHGHGWADQLLRAHRLGASVGRVSPIEKIAVLYGFREDVMGSAALTSVGWRIWNVSALPEAAFAMEPVYKPNASLRLHWPRRPANVQRRQDYKCTSLKLLAWNLTQFERVMVSDTDVCVLEDLLPWMTAHWGEYFIATPQGLDRPYQGISSHFMFLQPNGLVFQMLRDMGQSRSYIPYTNSEQDIIETMFATRKTMPKLPTHRHDRFQPKCDKGKLFSNSSGSDVMSATDRAQLPVPPRVSHMQNTHEAFFQPTWESG
ncbi:hypothetical protein AB1Y20_004337 [Prymnesium parvum]|uniref:Hexosyltransferase n=1 Tax=Prymnesium parvum TaxID=97485 RepID=A0AB34J003_PRYPA